MPSIVVSALSAEFIGRPRNDDRRLGQGPNVSVRPLMILYAANREPRARPIVLVRLRAVGFLGFGFLGFFAALFHRGAWGNPRNRSTHAIKCDHLHVRHFPSSSSCAHRCGRRASSSTRSGAELTGRKPRRSARGGWPHGTRRSAAGKGDVSRPTRVGFMRRQKCCRFVSGATGSLRQCPVESRRRSGVGGIPVA